VTGKSVVGTARVVREAYGDPTSEDGDWSCVDLIPRQAFPTPVTLEEIKANPALRDIALLRQSRLSVMQLTSAEAEVLCKLGGLA